MTTLVILIISASHIGLTWDEPDYISGSQSYIKWLKLLAKFPEQALNSKSIDMYWSINSEHPPVVKMWSGLIWNISRHYFDDLTANRMGVMIIVATLMAFLFQTISKIYDKTVGLVAVIALLTMPRFFLHSQLLALDIPVAAGIFFLAMFYWLTIERNEWWWGVLLGFCWGLVVASKLNAVMLYFGLIIWSYLFQRNSKTVLRLFLMGLFGCLTFFLTWPWLYSETFNKLSTFINFHYNHFKIGQWYLGSFHEPPPWHFVPFIIISVVPITTLVLALSGIFGSLRSTKNKNLIVFFIIIILSYLSPFLFGSLIYDNDRLFMPVFPFIAVFAGIGFKVIFNYLNQLINVSHKLIVKIVIISLLIIPQTLQMIKIYPHLLSYYSESVGGLKGANKRGMETTYWCETYKAAIPYINKHAKAGDLIWVEDWTSNVLLYYQMQGILRSDVRILSTVPSDNILNSEKFQPVHGELEEAQWYLFQFRQSQFYSGEKSNKPFQIVKNMPIAFEVMFEGIPLMRLFKREK